MNSAPDWRNLPLDAPGRSLIEASAGTGKTWTLTALYLRLLLEQPLSPRRIVVATYTHAAADELKERLRLRIEQALALAMQAAAASTDPVAAWLQTRWREAPPRRAEDARRLALALAELDIAPIGTLHSLCLRMLSEHPFASGNGFAPPALIDSQGLILELSQDLWRLLHADTAPDQPVAQTLRQLAPALQPPLDLDDLHATLKLALQAGVQAPAASLMPEIGWDADLGARLCQLARHPEWFRKGANLPKQMTELGNALLQQDSNALAALLHAETHLQERLENRTGLIKAGLQHAPLVQALDQAAAFVQQYQNLQRALRQQFNHLAQGWAQSQRDARLARTRQLGFDDLLEQVRQLLERDPRRTLADTLYQAWPVALIDEFQDTDPTQYAILDAIWRDASGQLRGHLLLIGDPKQAIYRFRGGDIHTYCRARAEVPPQAHLCLDVNWRSDARYLQALDRWYAIVGPQLSAKPDSDGIRFSPVRAATDAPSPLSGSGQPPPALRLYDSGPEDQDETQALLSCANRIVQLLDPAQGWRLHGQPLQASDLCVLLPNNQQARCLSDYLRERGVAVVDRGRANVFESETARELCLLLDAVLHCQQPRRLRAAIATRLLGQGYQNLRRLQDDAAGWQAWSALFHHWHRLWQRCGILAVVMAVQQRIAAAQLEHLGGERVLTDLRHLGELLQDAEREQADPAALLQHFSKNLQHPGDSSDEQRTQALRLESDARCVQVMTLHASKGLEFPLLLLPLLWKHSGRKPPGQALWNSAGGQRELVLDPARLEAVTREEQDERFRVLYVALTRARHACEIWLGPKRTVKDDFLAAPLTLIAERLRTALSQTQDPSAASLVLEPHWPPASPRLHQRPASTEPAPKPRQARPLPPPRHTPLPARHSFTTLTASAPLWLPETQALDETPDPALPAPFDTPADTPADTPLPHAALELLQPLAGTDFGNALHAILERRRIGQPLAQQQALIGAQLALWGVHHPHLTPASFARKLAARLDDVLDADLDGHGLRLSALPASALRCEMEFHYLLAGTRLSQLQAACAAAGEPQLVPRHEQTLSGLMNGKIDLLFQYQGRVHVLDWKSNRLGQAQRSGLHDYAPAALEQAMDAHHYRFQALLYSLALERYLRSRLGPAYRRADHLGDCWYLFLRATGLHLPDGRACGIWRQRFDDALLDAAQAALSPSAPGTEP